MTSAPGSTLWDAAIVGAGPAGASCSIWLKLLGFQPIVIDRRRQPGGRLSDSPYANPWTATARRMATGLSLADDITTNLADQDVPLVLEQDVLAISRSSSAFSLRLSGGRTLAARTAVLASGLTAATGGLQPSHGVFFGPGQAVFDLDVADKAVAILGGGDNAFDHAALLRERGASRIRIFARTMRARPTIVAAAPGIEVTTGRYEVDVLRHRVGGEAFDLLLVMYGFEPSHPPLEGLDPQQDERGYVMTHWQTAETSEHGLYAIGDVAARGHPSVPTALADGVAAAKAIEARLIRKP